MTTGQVAEANVCVNCDGVIVGPDNLGSHDNPMKCVRVLRARLLAPETPYDIHTDSLTAAVARLVEAAKKENPSLGTFKAECHDGSTLTIRFRRTPVKPSKLRSLAAGIVFSETRDDGKTSIDGS
jgi:hypothetical protein